MVRLLSQPVTTVFGIYSTRNTSIITYVCICVNNSPRQLVIVDVEAQQRIIYQCKFTYYCQMLFVNMNIIYLNRKI